MMRTDELSQPVALLGIELGKAGRQSLKVTKVVRGQNQKGPWTLLIEDRGYRHFCPLIFRPEKTRKLR